ncbi:arginyl-tRNA synthetase [Natronocella acetinitrilica]|uniref:Arginine--tRNA ligase n=1 Tax=Natronocella acetinitrilica TaxID=414046 RepID=A0AAE3G8M4_9GAMM|nr:arginine--tRNA ligase [Natronocella acetinitrilica]MCP1676796.1 arginyl-tRNA synthetase [Natronocella acetinitrilica]
MKEQIRALIEQALQRLQADGTIPEEVSIPIQVERTKDRRHGDFALNTAMMLAKPARRKPREIAEALVAAMPTDAAIHRYEIAGPGFINVFLSREAAFLPVSNALAKANDYGRVERESGNRILLEYVSANPTGPLHVGHGRGAAFGSALANLLLAAGHSVQQEYYVNDAGRQMDILAASVWLRYLELQGEEIRIPDNAYRGEYVRDIARDLQQRDGDRHLHPAAIVLCEMPLDGSEGGDKENYIDTVIERCKTVLGAAAYEEVFKLALDTVLDDIRDDLAGFGVHHDVWFSERSLTGSSAIEHALDILDRSDHLYEADGAIWFRSSSLGDEKDRVVRRDNGVTTYFASDIAYHLNKFERGFDQCIDILGADHHGYIGRLKASLEALGRDPAGLDIRLVQFAILYRGTERMQMSTRSGQFVTLRELRDEVGTDAARFFYVLRKPEQHLDFDLELAKSQSADNPVYYIQYAHARICSVMRQLEEKSLSHDLNNGLAHLTLLTEEHEQVLVDSIGQYPELVANAAQAREPHQLAHYLRDLANAVHTYYNAHQFLVEDAALRDARLCLVLAARQVIRNGLGILGVTAPEAM